MTLKKDDIVQFIVNTVDGCSNETFRIYEHSPPIYTIDNFSTSHNNKRVPITSLFKVIDYDPQRIVNVLLKWLNGPYYIISFSTDLRKISNIEQLALLDL